MLMCFGEVLKNINSSSTNEQRKTVQADAHREVSFHINTLLISMVGLTDKDT